MGLSSEVIVYFFIHLVEFNLLVRVEHDGLLATHLIYTPILKYVEIVLHSFSVIEESVDLEWYFVIFVHTERNKLLCLGIVPSCGYLALIFH